MSRIVVIGCPDDDLERIIEAPQSAGFWIIRVEHGEGWGELLYETEPGVIVISGDSVEGQQLCPQIRDRSNIPIIAVCAERDEIGRAAMLELGADTCISRPVSVAELIARVRSLLRRYSMSYSRVRSAQSLHYLCFRKTIPVDGCTDKVMEVIDMN